MLIFNVSILTSNYGPSDRVRTCGLMVPNHPRYQLRYTRLFDFCFLEISLSVVIPVVKGFFAASFRRREKPENIGAARLSGIGAGRGPDTGAALPNHPRYQLRYTRKSVKLRPFRRLSGAAAAELPEYYITSSAASQLIS
jgi:hypothetical protein